MNLKLIIKLEIILNMLGVLAIIFVSSMAIFYQVTFNELPCPLCLLQRIGFLGVAYGYMRNLLFGLKPSHYAIALISAIFTSLVALRQIALHIIPGSPTYGQAFLGLHFYTWSFVAAVMFMVGTIFMMSIDRQFETDSKKFNMYPKITHTLFLLVSAIFIINMISSLGICGWGFCPDDPTNYSWPHF